MKTVLFVCVHNAGRSQMAEAFLNHYATAEGLPIRALSAGTIAGSALNPQAVVAMEEVGVPMDGQYSKMITSEMARDAERIITMGCGVDAEACPASFLVTEDWGLDDPANQSMDVVRTIRDQVQDRVLKLIEEMKEELK